MQQRWINAISFTNVQLGGNVVLVWPINKSKTNTGDQRARHSSPGP